MSFKTRLFLMLLVMGLVFTVLGVKDMIILSKDPIEVMDEDPEDLNAGDHVILDVSAVFPPAISVTETRKTMGVTTSSKESNRYYCIPYLHTVKEGGLKIVTPYPDMLIFVKVGSNYFDKMENAYEKTVEWMDQWYEINDSGKDLSRLTAPPATGIRFEGSLKKMNKESLGYAIEYAEELEDFMWATEAGKSYSAEDSVVPYYIEPIMVKSAPPIMTLIGLALLIVPGIMIFLYFKQKKEEQAMVQAISRSVSRETYGPGTGDENLAKNNNVSSMVKGAFAQPGANPQAMGGAAPMSGAAQPFGGAAPMSGAAQPFGGAAPMGGAAQPFGGAAPMSGSAQPMGAQSMGAAQAYGAGTAGSAKPMGAASTAGSPYAAPAQGTVSAGSPYAAPAQGTISAGSPYASPVQPMGPSQTMGPSQPSGTAFSQPAASSANPATAASPVTPVTPVTQASPVTPVTAVTPAAPIQPAQPAQPASAPYFQPSQPVQLPYSSGVAPSAAQGNTSGSNNNILGGGGKGF
ncbi:MAG: hypothetical protein K5686_04075 [Lachnospiraceae bacterium]|nr:hypothetical protein [Lachnospiraceae bacterium]